MKNKYRRIYIDKNDDWGNVLYDMVKDRKKTAFLSYLFSMAPHILSDIEAKDFFGVPPDQIMELYENYKLLKEKPITMKIGNRDIVVFPDSYVKYYNEKLSGFTDSEYKSYVLSKKNIGILPDEYPNEIPSEWRK